MFIEYHVYRGTWEDKIGEKWESGKKLRLLNVLVLFIATIHCNAHTTNLIRMNAIFPSTCSLFHITFSTLQYSHWWRFMPTVSSLIQLLITTEAKNEQKFNFDAQWGQTNTCFKCIISECFKRILNTAREIGSVARMLLSCIQKINLPFI